MVQDDDKLYQAKLTEHWQIVEALTRRRFRDAKLAEAARNYVLDKLAEYHWARLKAYRGEAAFATYLGHLAHRLLEDFARHQFGRRRLPDWLRIQGSLWEQVHQLLCLERLPAAEVIAMLSATRTEDGAEQAIREALTVIRRRIPDCGKVTYGNPSRSLTGQWDRSYPQTGNSTPDTQKYEVSAEERYIATQRARLLAALHGDLVGSDARLPPDDPWLQAVARLRAALQPLQLTTEERLLLRLVFQERLPATTAGQRLNIGPTQVQGRLRRLLQRIAKSLQDAGLTEELRSLVYPAVG